MLTNPLTTLRTWLRQATCRHRERIPFAYTLDEGDIFEYTVTGEHCARCDKELNRSGQNKYTLDDMEQMLKEPIL